GGGGGGGGGRAGQKRKQTSKVRFVYARCDADASYLAYKGLTCRFLASGNIAYLH
ncbi:hypothetical protein HMPREF9534_02261, partial [Escherichia coli MS 69-1]